MIFARKNHPSIIQQKRKSGGFTLLEVLLYTSLMTFVFGALVGLFILVLQARVSNVTRSEVEAQGRFLIHTVSRHVRTATDILEPLPGEVSDTLRLATPDTNTSTETEFFVSENTLMLVRDGEEALPLNTPRLIVSDVSFVNRSHPDTPGLVSVSFTLSHYNPEGQRERAYTQTFETSISLRPYTQTP